MYRKSKLIAVTKLLSLSLTLNLWRFIAAVLVDSDELDVGSVVFNSVARPRASGHVILNDAILGLFQRCLSVHAMLFSSVVAAHISPRRPSISGACGIRAWPHSLSRPNCQDTNRKWPDCRRDRTAGMERNFALHVFLARALRKFHLSNPT